MALYVEAVSQTTATEETRRKTEAGDSSFSAVLNAQYEKALEEKRKIEENAELKRVCSVEDSSKDAQSYWERRLKRHKESMELSEEAMMKRKLEWMLQRRRQLMYDSDGMPTGYLSGISAAEIMSGLL